MSDTVTRLNAALEGRYAIEPGGKGAVFAVNASGNFRIQAVDLETGEVTDLTAGTHPGYSATGPLLFMSDDATLLAAPFDVGAGSVMS